MIQKLRRKTDQCLKLEARMLNLPVSATTFKKSFLGGDGQIEINTDEDAWRSLYDSKATFNKDVDRVADVTFGVNATTPLTLGRADTLKIGVSAGVQAVNQIQ